MQTVRQHQKGGRWTSTKKQIVIKDWEIDKYTYLRGNFTAQLNIHGENSQRLKAVNYFRRKASPQMFFWALNMPLYLIRLTCLKTCVSTKKLYKQKTTNTLT